MALSLKEWHVAAEEFLSSSRLKNILCFTPTDLRVEHVESTLTPLLHGDETHTHPIQPGYA